MLWWGDDGYLTGMDIYYLVGALEPWNFMFPYIGNFILPNDEREFGV
jgi:hypothetical protein